MRGIHWKRVGSFDVDVDVESRLQLSKMRLSGRIDVEEIERIVQYRRCSRRAWTGVARILSWLGRCCAVYNQSKTRVELNVGVDRRVEVGEIVGVARGSCSLDDGRKHRLCEGCCDGTGLRAVLQRPDLAFPVTFDKFERRLDWEIGVEVGLFTSQRVREGEATELGGFQQRTCFVVGVRAESGWLECYLLGWNQGCS